jgi:small subunit ribosomal protein S6
MSAAAGADLNGSVEFIREVLNRAGAEILVLRKWDERKLAYPIKGQKRGLYIIAYFRVKHTMLANIDRDCNLSEQVIRNLVIRADHMGEVEIEMEKKEVAHTRTEAALRSDDRSRPSGRAAPKSSPADEEAPVGLSTGEFQDN